MQTAQSGVARLQFHTNTAAICGDFKPRDSPDYPISYRYYGAFCAADQAALDTDRLSADAAVLRAVGVPAGSRRPVRRTSTCRTPRFRSSARTPCRAVTVG